MAGARAIKPFELERYFALHEFNAPHLLCCSDIQALTMAETLAEADEECKHLWDNLSLQYTESQGLPQLRTEISRLYDNIAADDTIVVAPEEGIYLTMRALLSRGDHVVVTSPCYQSLSEIAASIGCRISCWAPRGGQDEKSDMYFDVADLQSLVRPETKLITVNFPHNPTGCLLSRREFARVIDIARKAGSGEGAFVFSDEMYRLLEYSVDDRLPAACDAYERAITLSGMSKVFAMPGLRIGWLATRCASVLSRVQELKDFTTICPPAPSEVLALIGLRARDTLLLRNNTLVQRNLELVRAFMQRHASHFGWTKPRAGPIALLRLRSHVGIAGATESYAAASAARSGQEEISSRAYCDALVQAHGIMLLPSSVFGFGDRHVRLGLGRSNLPDVLAMWERTIVSAAGGAPDAVNSNGHGADPPPVPPSRHRHRPQRRIFGSGGAPPSPFGIDKDPHPRPDEALPPGGLRQSTREPRPQPFGVEKDTHPRPDEALPPGGLRRVAGRHPTESSFIFG